MGKLRASVAAVIAVGVMSMGATACTTPPSTPEDQARLEQWIQSSLSGLFYFWFLDWYSHQNPCPTCV
jgi:hypothetical protein